MKEKIVLIGAGSAVFTQGLVADIIRAGFEAEVALVDIDPDALRVVDRLVRKMVTLRRAPITVTADVDRRKVLPGATAVICMIGVGGRRAWEQDVFIPRKYGIFMPVGDTVGPGGSSRALRMIPAMVAIANDVLELAPEALFFNYGNPMAPVCHAIRKATGANVIGLCHGVFDVSKYLAEKLGVSHSELQYTAVGINHLTWYTTVMVNGRDAMPQLRRIAQEIVAKAPPSDRPFPPDVQPDLSQPFSSTMDNPFSWSLLLQFGAIPSALDRHVTEFFPQFFRDGRYYGRRLGVDEFSFEGTIAEGDDTYAEMQAAASAADDLSEEHFAHVGGEHEQVVDILLSIRSSAGKVYSANLPNRGQAPNLPPEAIIEAPAVADAHGLRPLVQPPLPAAMAGILATRYQWVEAIVEAALECSREKFVQALVLDGAVSSFEQAEALAAELLQVQAPYLQWK